ncbi:hypothetical protein [Aquimarina sp. 2201CG5-10]|uniref:hypothetical protein n=1 Tax=Aquimarina callyspongiae TaxID=3098150 RepID=UPI002AB55185|nr:hypothetical protein [Aquimarina sp. 2201CG5-10]MDY8138465.1 hypothetical protein [Aquimarina sp. 2201CG5-10]
MESVIAITIIATCLLIAIRLYATVLNSSSSINSYRTKFKVSQLYNQVKINRDFDDEVYDFKTFSIQKKVVDFQGNKELKNVKYIVQTLKDTIVYNYLLHKNDKDE